MRMRWSLTGIAVTALIAAGYVVLPLTTDSAEGMALRLGGTCILSCDGCTPPCDLFCPPPGPVPFHVADRVGDDNEYGGGWHELPDCFWGSCADQHPACEPDQMAMAEVRDAINAGDAARLAQVAATAPSVARVEGSALQLLDCDGHVIAHIPFDLLGSVRVAD